MSAFIIIILLMLCSFCNALPCWINCHQRSPVNSILTFTFCLLLITNKFKVENAFKLYSGDDVSYGWVIWIKSSITINNQSNTDYNTFSGNSIKELLLP